MALAGGRFWLLTPRGAGGVAVVARCGSDRHAVVAPLLGSARRQGVPSRAFDGAPHLVWLWLHGRPLDQAIVLDRPEEEQLELHLHGSPAVLAALAADVGGLEPPPRSPAEALAQAALDDAQLALALEQQALLPRGFEAWLREQEPGGADVQHALLRSRVALALARPAPLAIIGAKNAGKSTLMNRLLLEERVLAGPEPGLTRDPVEEPVELGGYPYALVDTPGEGSALGDLDRRAMSRGRQARAEALRILVVDGAAGPSDLTRELFEEAPDRTLVLRSKADLPRAPWPPGAPPIDLSISCLDPAGAPAVRVRIGEALRVRRSLPPAGPVGGPAALDEAQLAALMALGRGPS
jgi:small GTP-binding protein